MYDKQTLEKKRSQVKELFFQKHLNKSVIASQLAVSRPFVHRWTGIRNESVKDTRTMSGQKLQLPGRFGQKV